MNWWNINFILLFGIITCIYPLNCFPLTGDSSTPVPTPSAHMVHYSIVTDEMTTFLRRFPRAAESSWTATDSDTPSTKFRKYHNCIRAKNKHTEFPRTALLSQEGQEVELSCNLCLRPDQDLKTIAIGLEWRRFQLRRGEEGPIPHNPKRFILTKSKSLLIKNLDVMDAGQYVCLRNGQPETFYQIDVLFKEPRRTFMRADPKEKPASDVKLVDENLKLFTTWSEWSQCNKCGEKGFRRKIGLCTVKKISNLKPIQPVDIPNMKHYPNGVPCRSTVLPRSVAKMPIIRDRQSETMMDVCWEPCPTVAEIRQITDSSGKVIKVVEVQYYSLNEAPILPQLPKRDVMHKDAGRRLILKCPIGRDGKKKADLIRWQNGTVLINPLNVRRDTRGRVRIDHNNRLLIRRLKVTDTAAFNCWLGGRHVATFKVIVTKPFNKDIKSYISYAGCGVTVLAIVIIAFSLCCKKPTKTAK